MKNNQLLAGAIASVAALVLMACSKTETIDAGTPPAVAPAASPAEAPAPTPVAGAVKADEFRAFSASAEPEARPNAPAPGSLQAEAAAFAADAKKAEKKVAGIPPEQLKGPASTPKPLVLEAPGSQ